MGWRFLCFWAAGFFSALGVFGADLARAADECGAAASIPEFSATVRYEQGSFVVNNQSTYLAERAVPSGSAAPSGEGSGGWRRLGEGAYHTGIWCGEDSYDDMSVVYGGSGSNFTRLVFVKEGSAALESIRLSNGDEIRMEIRAGRFAGGSQTGLELVGDSESMLRLFLGSATTDTVRVETQSAGAHGIRVSTSDMDMDVGTASSVVDVVGNGGAIIFDSDGAPMITETLEAAYIRTQGAASHGISAEGRGSGSVLAVDIDMRGSLVIFTEGAGSHGIYAQTLSGNAGGVDIDIQGGRIITGSASGDSSHAIFSDVAGSGDSDIDISAQAIIRTFGEGSVGIRANTAGGALAITAPGEITVTGAGAEGIHASSEGGDVEITVGGFIRAEGGAGVVVDFTDAPSLTIDLSGSIETGDPDSSDMMSGMHGIHISPMTGAGEASSAVVMLSGSGGLLTSHEGGSDGVRLGEATLPLGSAMVMSAGNSRISARGDGSAGIRVYARTGINVMFSGNSSIRTRGADAPAIELRALGNMAGDSSDLSITLDQNSSLLTEGARSRGVHAEKANAGALRILANGIITTTGSAIFARGAGGGEISIEANRRLSTSGDNAHIIDAYAMGSGFVAVGVGLGAVLGATGSGSRGVFVRSDRGRLDLLITEDSSVSVARNSPALVVMDGGSAIHDRDAPDMDGVNWMRDQTKGRMSSFMASESYETDDIVLRGGMIYRAILVKAAGTEFVADNWEVVDAAAAAGTLELPEWASRDYYPNGDMVVHETGVYAARGDIPAASPLLENNGRIAGDILFIRAITASDLGDPAFGEGHDRLINQSGGVIEGGIYTGFGDDEIQNSGRVMGGIYADCHARALQSSDVTCQSSGASMLEGDDVITNSGGASLLGDVAMGGGDDRFENAGIYEGSLTMGAGSDSFINSGTGAVLTGDSDFGSGSDSLMNSGTLTIRDGRVRGLEFFTQTGGSLRLEFDGGMAALPNPIIDMGTGAGGEALLAGELDLRGIAGVFSSVNLLRAGRVNYAGLRVNASFLNRSEISLEGSTLRIILTRDFGAFTARGADAGMTDYFRRVSETSPLAIEPLFAALRSASEESLPRSFQTLMPRAYDAPLQADWLSDRLFAKSFGTQDCLLTDWGRERCGWMRLGARSFAQDSGAGDFTEVVLHISGGGSFLLWRDFLGRAWHISGAFSYESSDLDFSSSGSGRGDRILIGAALRADSADSFVYDLSVNLGLGLYEVKRGVLLSGIETVVGEPDTITVSARAGLEYRGFEAWGWSFVPRLEGSATGHFMDSFTESGGAAALHIEAIREVQASLSPSFEASRSLRTVYGVFSARAGVSAHSFLTDPRLPIRARLASDATGQTPFRIEGSMERALMEISLEVNLAQSDRVKLGLSYRGLFGVGGDSVVNSGRFRVRYLF